MKIFEDLDDILFVDEINIGSCILEDSKTSLDVVARQIWEGNKSIIDILKKIGAWVDKSIANSQCNGVKDILMDWKANDIKTLIFYMPKTTVKAIRQKISNRKPKTRIIAENIENYIATQCKRNIKDVAIYNLDNRNHEVENIFDISVLKKELDNDSRGSEKIYFIGLKYNLNSSEINTYMNNIPI
ncbi:MAG: hypothetical protein KAU90_09330, partial [Sulfurovaceae bacterium]|nr:hypothetical protein [Sulfurovaceae bacterium]